MPLTLPEFFYNELSFSLISCKGQRIKCDGNQFNYLSVTFKFLACQSISFKLHFWSDFKISSHCLSLYHNYDVKIDSLTRSSTESLYCSLSSCWCCRYSNWVTLHRILFTLFTLGSHATYQSSSSFTTLLFWVSLYVYIVFVAVNLIGIPLDGDGLIYSSQASANDLVSD